jgi:hypothetical protein
MVSHTPLYNIPYPDPTDKPKDAAAHFQGIANGVEAALQAASIPPVISSATMVAASAAARDAYWGTPTLLADQLTLQNRGATTIRTDTGWTERYFAPYNATTNPGGATPVGWYPVSGNVPAGLAKRTATAVSAGNAAYANMSATAGWTTAGTGLLAGGMTYANGFVIPVAGLYEVGWSILQGGGASIGIVGIARNAPGTVGGNLLYAIATMQNGGAYNASGAGIVELAAGDLLTLWGYGNAAAWTIQNTESSSWWARYLQPAV